MKQNKNYGNITHITEHRNHKHIRFYLDRDKEQDVYIQTDREI